WRRVWDSVSVFVSGNTSGSGVAEAICGLRKRRAECWGNYTPPWKRGECEAAALNGRQHTQQLAVKPAIGGDQVGTEGIERVPIGGGETAPRLRHEERGGHHVPRERV